MSNAPQTDYDEPQAIADILGRVARELREAATQTDHLHCLVESVAWHNVKEKHEIIRSAQAIDSLEQTLSALSDFVLAISELSSPEWEVAGAAASRRVRLAELAARLADRSPNDATNSSGGEFEFF